VSRRRNSTPRMRAPARARASTRTGCAG
jgi:hypothetical protein